MQSLTSLLIVLLIVGVVLYLINTYLPMAPVVKTIFNIIVVLAVVIWLLQSAGLIAHIR